MSAERLFVEANDATTSFLDAFGHLRGASARLVETAFAWNESLRARFGFSRTASNWCPLDHGRGSILALPLLTHTSESLEPGMIGIVAERMETTLPVLRGIA